MIMTQDLKNSLKIVLDMYKQDKITEEEVFVLIGSLIDNNKSGGTIITYPDTYPYYNPKRNWWDDLPQWTVTCTIGDNNDFKQNTTDTVNFKS